MHVHEELAAPHQRRHLGEAADVVVRVPPPRHQLGPVRPRHRPRDPHLPVLPVAEDEGAHPHPRRHRPQHRPRVLPAAQQQPHGALAVAGGPHVLREPVPQRLRGLVQRAEGAALHRLPVRPPGPGPPPPRRERPLRPRPHLLHPPEDGVRKGHRQVDDQVRRGHRVHVAVAPRRPRHGVHVRPQHQPARPAVPQFRGEHGHEGEQVRQHPPAPRSRVDGERGELPVQPLVPGDRLAGAEETVHAPPPVTGRRPPRGVRRGPHHGIAHEHADGALVLHHDRAVVGRQRHRQRSPRAVVLVDALRDGSQVALQVPAQHPGLDPPRGEEEVAHRAPMAALTRLARGSPPSPDPGRGGNCGCRCGAPPFPRLRGRGGRGVRGPDPEGASANPA